jgi:hypothetical protein
MQEKTIELLKLLGHSQERFHWYRDEHQD